MCGWGHSSVDVVCGEMTGEFDLQLSNQVGNDSVETYTVLTCRAATGVPYRTVR